MESQKIRLRSKLRSKNAPMEPSHSPQEQQFSEVSTLLRAWSEGDETALAQLTPMVYDELRRVAHRQMRRERGERTLQTTALVNEAYLRLVDARGIRWEDRAHFFAISAQIMRRILIDYARRNNLKRGAGFQHVSLEQAELPGAAGDPDLIALDEALNELQQFDPRKAKVVELRFFGGLSVEETAEALKVSPITVIRDWNNAKAWLYRELATGAADGP
jgi:RNA polymerase sigma factor (TIGR02999 family)